MKAARILYTEASEAQLRELKCVAMERGLPPYADLCDREESNSESAAGADWALAMGWVRLCAVMGLVERC